MRGGPGGPPYEAVPLTGMPPKLEEHIAALRERGYNVKAVDNGEIAIVIKDYKIPGSIWSRPSADLRIATDATYPESKLGPFWLHPPVTRKNGDSINGAGSTEWDGKTWQTFCWSVVRWDPVYDNLLTHLDVVDERMRRDE